MMVLNPHTRDFWGNISLEAQRYLDVITNRKTWMILIYLRFNELKGLPSTTYLTFKKIIPTYTRPYLIVLQNLPSPPVQATLDGNGIVLTNVGRKTADFYIWLCDGIMKTQKLRTIKELAEQIKQEMQVTKEEIDKELAQEEEDLARDDLRARLYEKKPHVRTTKYEEVQS